MANVADGSQATPPGNTAQLPPDGQSEGSPEPDIKGLLPRFWRHLFGATTEKRSPTGVAGSTRLVMQVLWFTFAIGLAIEFAYGLSLPTWQQALFFIGWAWIASLAAALAGGFFGLLFGLPSLPLTRPSTRVETPPAAASPGSTAAAADSDAGVGPPTVTVETPTTRVEQELPYNDSTSLEQIADWLTKIIVGLTLTQYESWSQAFTMLSRGLTLRLLGASPCPGATAGARLRPECVVSEAVPGAAIVLAFAVTGFLVAYLWMRRYFIIEMIVGKREAQEAMNRRAAVAMEVLNRRIAAERARARAEADEQHVREQRNRAQELEAKAAILEAELRAARAQVNEAVASARTYGTAQREPFASPRADGTAEREILLNARRLAGGDDSALAALDRIANAPLQQPDDPWLGRFGGRDRVDGLLLEARAEALEASAFFALTLEVNAVASDEIARIAGTTALFFLHPTFGDRPVPVVFGQDGRAPLQLYAYGAFTVGVLLLKDGRTLELNTATIPQAPDQFRSR